MTATMVTKQSIDDFLAQEKIAVAGVSRKSKKFGDIAFKELKKKGYDVYPVNPHMSEYKGAACYHSVSDLPREVSGVLVCTPHDTTLQIVDEAKEKGIKHVWLQQGSVDEEKLDDKADNNLNVITGQCIMMYAVPVNGIHGFHRWINKVFGKIPS
jgi:predicted CoA-binding protein